MSGPFNAVYRLVRRVPHGRVSSYGDIAAMCAEEISPRTVGWAMSASPKDVPWHRIVNRRGRLTIGRRSVALLELQRSLLESEGVEFVHVDQVDMEKHRWTPRRVPQAVRKGRRS
ncbi:MAG: MGMT family protein [Acidobacteria bacterium]|nr:MGMT family protein [Acidobacteriota bacterium]